MKLWPPIVLALACLVPSAAPGQVPPFPAPAPRPPVPAADDDSLNRELPPVDGEDRSPWPGLPEGIAASLAKTSDRYAEHAVRFSCFETVREARYENGQAEKEEVRRYGYLLERPGSFADVREVRQKLRGDEVTRDEVRDDSPFPPAYAWVFMFSRFHQSYFAYRFLEERFEGYDWVYVIQFRGALPYTDGKDIRQWEGTALVDAVTYAPIEIVAEPSRQKERLRLLFDQYSQAFNIIGLRTAPRPFGYGCRVSFRLRQDRLAFPTELRYDTYRAVSSKKTVPWTASIRTYDDYRFFRTETTEKADEPKPR